ncbi:hypothetical protein AAGV28_08445 [Flavobacterium sp. FZUC8N2.13]|uniref:TonB-dependent receptor plug domain-containing protein n=1 Tax=Flavobacterium zubiriense TaxID=3138075 RepID=A0ABV4TBD6_9FLAO
MFVLSIVFLQAQDKKTIKADVEKVYLHTDRSTYFIGEDIWYKAYNVRASNNLLFDNSNILYVELISSESKIIAQNKTNLEMGLGHGDFQLQDSLGVKPGIYQLRAYTNWNRNFGDDFVFKKDIEIIDVFESNDKSKTAQNIASETKITKKEAAKQNTFRIDFFPEGGSLIENVSSIVGFKAVDNNGKPIEINGEIYDSNNELVTAFESVHDGMGKFQMLPMEGKSYYAKIKTSTGIELRQELPNILKQGYSLSFKGMKGRNIVSINTNQATLAQNPNAALTVIGKAKGITYLETTQTLTETTLSFELPKDKFPAGISQITLFDNANKPQSERLIYIEKENDLEVELVTDKETYEPNEKTIVYVSSKSKKGVAKSASFSLSVTDMNGVEDKDFGTTISSYFLMESDIRGKVHHPGYYFDATNPKRLEHLDNLLLTQGWRDFIWKTNPNPNKTIRYAAEKGLEISGRVKQLLGKKAKVNSNMSLSLMGKKGMQFFNTATDSIGKFKFENLIFYNTTQLFLSTKDDKGKFSGEIVLDSVYRTPPPVGFQNESIGFSETIKSIADNVLKKYTAFGIKPENRLNEVKITAKKKYATVLYGRPDFDYKMDKEGLKFSSASDLIMDKFQMFDFNKLISPESFSTIEGLPVILIDGNPINELAQLNFVSPEEIEKIEALRGTEMLKTLYGPDAGLGVISIFTNGKSTGNQPKKDINQSIKIKIDGYYLGRTFYAPTPEQAELDVIAAVRNTIYWNPELRPDKTGNATVNYYNTKVETKVKVALEGITASGIPVVKNVYYTIKN